MPILCPRPVSISAKNPLPGLGATGAFKEGRGLKTGDLTGPFFARPFIDGKQVWKALFASTFVEAKREVGHVVTAKLQKPSRVTKALPEVHRSANRVPLPIAVETYLQQKSGKSQKTIYQYQRTLNEFQEVVGQRIGYLDEITEDALRTYKNCLEAEGYAGNTIDTRLNIVFFLLKKNGIAARIPRDEMPVVEEVAAPYTDAELTKLFAAMDDEERIRYKFFPGSGCRDKEVTFAAWSDIDFDKKA